VNTPIEDNGYQWQPPPGQQSGALRYLWNHPVVIAGVMGMLLLLVTAVSIVAIKAVGSEGSAAGTPDDGGRQEQTGQPAGPAATPTGTGSPPANQPVGTQAGTQPVAGSVPQTTGAVFLNGKMSIYSYDNGVDFDGATKSSNSQNYDIEVDDTSFAAANRAKLGIGATAASPEACANAAVKWGDSAHLSVLANGAVICVRTSDNRLGVFTVGKLEKSSDGQLSQLDIDYVVWKKPDDQ
jgi:hypothetical protein